MTLENLKKSVCDHFDFVVTEFGYRALMPHESATRYYVPFLNDQLHRMVQLEYSKKYDFVEIAFYRNVSEENSPSLQDRVNSVSLSYIIQSKDELFDYQSYNSYMPAVLGLDSSLAKLATLTRKYCTSYLDGTEWHGWGELIRK